MQLSKIALAAAAVVVGTSAFAGPNASRIAISAGASATRLNLETALANMCSSAGGTQSAFISGNFRTFVCANAAVTAGAAYNAKPNAEFINYQGTPYAEVRLNTEGSFSAVLLLNNQPLTFRDPTVASGNTTTIPAGAVKVGGLLDLEPTAFPASVIGSNTLFPATGVGIAQTFGIAVSNPLYTKLFDAQKAAGLLPASCTVASTNLPYCVPSISKGQMATIMADNPFNVAYSNGLSFLTGDSADDGVELRYIRRVDNSGTQASAQNYFLGLPCSANVLSIVPEPTSDDEGGGLKDALIGAIRVYAAPGTGDVLNELNKAGVYALGVVSGENVPASANWKWVRVQGANMAENATPAGNTNTVTMKNGRYDFYYESVYMGGTAAGNAFWSAVSNRLNTLPALPGLVNATDLGAGYTKSGNACAFNASN